MIICVSGTPGTGKTTLSRRLARELGLSYLDGNEIISKYNLSEGFDKKKGCKIVDTKRFAMSAIKECEKLKKGAIIDSHLSHNLPPSKISLCIICKADLKVLKKRLEKRGYSKAKVRENLDAEIFDVCLTEATEKGHDVIILKDYKPLLRKIKKELF